MLLIWLNSFKRNLNHRASQSKSVKAIYSASFDYCTIIGSLDYLHVTTELHILKNKSCSQSSLPEELPWKFESKVTSDGGTKVTGPWGTDLRDLSGPKISADQSLGLHLALKPSKVTSDSGIQGSHSDGASVVLISCPLLVYSWQPRLIKKKNHPLDKWRHQPQLSNVDQSDLSCIQQVYLPCKWYQLKFHLITRVKILQLPYTVALFDTNVTKTCGVLWINYHMVCCVVLDPLDRTVLGNLWTWVAWCMMCPIPVGDHYFPSLIWTPDGRFT